MQNLATLPPLVGRGSDQVPDETIGYFQVLGAMTSLSVYMCGEVNDQAFTFSIYGSVRGEDFERLQKLVLVDRTIGVFFSCSCDIESIDRRTEFYVYVTEHITQELVQFLIRELLRWNSMAIPTDALRWSFADTCGPAD